MSNDELTTSQNYLNALRPPKGSVDTYAFAGNGNGYHMTGSPFPITWNEFSGLKKPTHDGLYTPQVVSKYGTRIHITVSQGNRYVYEAHQSGIDSSRVCAVTQSFRADRPEMYKVELDVIRNPFGYLQFKHKVMVSPGPNGADSLQIQNQATAFLFRELAEELCSHFKHQDVLNAAYKPDGIYPEHAVMLKNIGNGWRFISTFDRFSPTYSVKPFDMRITEEDFARLELSNVVPANTDLNFSCGVLRMHNWAPAGFHQKPFSLQIPMEIPLSVTENILKGSPMIPYSVKVEN